MMLELGHLSTQIGQEDSTDPRDRLFGRGAAALTTAELLSLCLRTGTRGVPALWVAQALLADYGGIAPLLAAPPVRLLAHRGLGPAKVATLLAAAALADRRGAESLSREQPLADPAAATCYLQAALGHQSRELFGCLYLDARHRPLAFEVLFAGSVDRAHVHPRVIVKQALTYNASAIILAHNHPSGVCEPSGSDRALTERLARLLAEIDVNVVDHIIVAGTTAVSFAERGLVPGALRS